MKFLLMCLISMSLYSAEGTEEGKGVNPEAFAGRKKMALERIEKRMAHLIEAKACINAATEGKALKECRNKSKEGRDKMKEGNKEENQKFKEMRQNKRAEWKDKREKIKEEINTKKKELKEVK